MPNNLRWKVYRDGELVAACAFIEDAAMVIGASNCGEIRDNGRRVVYRDGDEGISAANSVDEIAALALRRIEAFTTKPRPAKPRPQTSATLDAALRILLRKQ